MSLVSFFLSSSPSVVQLECVEITHPNFSHTYRLVRNALAGVTVTHDAASGGGSFAYTFMPMKIRPLASSTDLDQEIEVTLGDVGEVIATELDRVSDGNGFYVKPIIKYRSYRSDDLANVLFGPVTLEINGISLTKEGASFKARAANFNLVRTGEIYSVGRFPMLEPLA